VSAADALVTVTGESWDARVLGAAEPVLVDFWAPWCVPCKKLEPALEDLAERHRGRLTVATLNVDEEPACAGRYDVLSLPTLMLFAGGEPVARLTGAVKPKKIEAAVAPHLPTTDGEGSP
jgi:thioredoxin 1